IRHTRFSRDWSSDVCSSDLLRWYVDGQQYHTINEGQFDATTWPNMTNHAGYFLLLNVAMGGAFPKALAGSTPTAATVSGRSMFRSEERRVGKECSRRRTRYH